MLGDLDGDEDLDLAILLWSTTRHLKKLLLQALTALIAGRILRAQELIVARVVPARKGTRVRDIRRQARKSQRKPTKGRWPLRAFRNFSP